MAGFLRFSEAITSALSLLVTWYVWVAASVAECLGLAIKWSAKAFCLRVSLSVLGGGFILLYISRLGGGF